MLEQNESTLIFFEQIFLHYFFVNYDFLKLGPVCINGHRQT
jgi:hypothetical protein